MMMDQLPLPKWGDSKHRKDTKVDIKIRPNTNPTQTMGATISNGSTITEQLP